MTTARAGGGALHSPHAPRTGLWRRVLGPFYFTGVFWYRFHLFGARILPEWLKIAFTPLVSTAFFLALGRVRSAVGRNLELVLGPCGAAERCRRAWRTIYGFSWSLTERYEQFVPRLSSFDVEVDTGGDDVWERLCDEGGGLVLVTAHIGNWEVASMVLANSRGARTIHVAREGELDLRSQAFIEGLLSAHGGARYKTHFLSDDLSSGLVLLDALRGGHIVALQGDRPRGGGHTVNARMFGVDVPLPVGPAVLARLANVPLVPVFTFREGRRRYRVCIRKPIRVERTGDRRADCEQATIELGAAIEWAVRREPLQWYCFADVRATQ